MGELLGAPDALRVHLWVHFGSTLGVLWGYSVLATKLKTYAFGVFGFLIIFNSLLFDRICVYVRNLQKN